MKEWWKIKYTSQKINEETLKMHLHVVTDWDSS